MGKVIFGLHLGPPEMRWNKFKSSYMFGNKEYHLRRAKFVVYQLALIFCVFSESLGTSVLSDFVDQQGFVENSTGHQYTQLNNDYVGVASFNIWAGIFTAFVFGAAFFFDLFWPERREDRGIKLAWKWCGVASIVFLTADALALTIVTARNRARVIGPDPAMVQTLYQQLQQMKRFPTVYRRNGRAVAAVVFVWLGWASTIASEIILWYSINHTDQHGPFTHSRRREIEGAGGSVNGHARGGPTADVYPDDVQLEEQKGQTSAHSSDEHSRTAHQHGVGAAAAAEDYEKNRNAPAV